jgi:hypothetical protein
MTTDIFNRIRNNEFKQKLPYAPPGSKERAAYIEEGTRMNEAFRTALFEEYDVTDNPKVEQCYSLAYEHGHGSGHNEIAIFFGDFVELIK